VLRSIGFAQAIKRWPHRSIGICENVMDQDSNCNCRGRGQFLIIDEEHQSIPDQYKAAADLRAMSPTVVEAGVTVVLTMATDRRWVYSAPLGLAKGVVPEVPVEYADAIHRRNRLHVSACAYNEFSAAFTAQVVTGHHPRCWWTAMICLANPTKPIGG